MTYTSLPPGVSPPLAEDNEFNHTGLVLIFASVCLFLVLSSLGMRIYATSKRSMILSDDYLLTVAVVRSTPIGKFLRWYRSANTHLQHRPSLLPKSALCYTKPILAGVRVRIFLILPS